MVSIIFQSPIFTPSRRCDMRRLAHGFLAARRHDLGIAIDDLLHAERHGARPEPHSWLAPGGAIGMPALIEAWRAGFWPWPAVRT